jgi:hypothetical protein
VAGAMKSRGDTLDAIEEILDWLPIGPLQILLRIAERLKIGVERYGSEFRFDLDLKAEADEELLDRTIYLGAESVKRRPV